MSVRQDRDDDNDNDTSSSTNGRGDLEPRMRMDKDDDNDITAETIAAAERLAGLDFTDDERALMLEGVRKLRDDYLKLRTVALPNDVPPALVFRPSPPPVLATPAESPAPPSVGADASPPGAANPSETPILDIRLRQQGGDASSGSTSDVDELAFASIAQLAALLRTRQISARELTARYLDRLRAFDSQLHCVVTLTEELAIRQARRADDELATGIDRGPLHGIPWGAKDLLAVRSYPTTWGSAAYREQAFDHDATVVERLEAAGAVLLAKLSLGELAMGDVWFGGRTNNPWNLEQGSSGSSAGSAAAVAGGLVGFAIGSETHGSIVSPATRCGVTGLRPTFGRVSRHGAMALSWSMDKLGPICRTVDDCALVFGAIAGADSRDPTAGDAPFAWPPSASSRPETIGVVQAAFDADRDNAAWAANDAASLAVLRSLGFELVPIVLPDLPIEALDIILHVEAAAAFDELTRTGRDDLLVRQAADAWPNRFRRARLVPAVEYLQANRVRSLAMASLNQTFADERIDVYVAPSQAGHNLLLTNLTGHPAVVVPNGFDEKGGPTSITFTGNLYAEAAALAVARAYQDATGFHLRRPPLGTPPGGKPPG